MAVNGEDPAVVASRFLHARGMTGEDGMVASGHTSLSRQRETAGAALSAFTGGGPRKTLDGYSLAKIRERMQRRAPETSDDVPLNVLMTQAPGVESPSDLSHVETEHRKKVQANRPRVETGDTDSNVVGGPISLGDTDVRTAGERDPRRRREPKPQRQATPEELERRRRRGPASATTPKRKKTRGPVGEQPLPGATSDERTAGKHGFTVI